MFEDVADGENPRFNLVEDLYIQYLINFRRKCVLALLYSGNEINAVYPIFAKKRGLTIRPTNIETQKIDSTILDIYGLVVVVFLVTNKANRVRFFEEIFLMANVILKVVLECLFSL